FVKGNRQLRRRHGRGRLRQLRRKRLIEGFAHGARSLFPAKAQLSHPEVYVSVMEQTPPFVGRPRYVLVGYSQAPSTRARSSTGQSNGLRKQADPKNSRKSWGFRFPWCLTCHSTTLRAVVDGCREIGRKDHLASVDVDARKNCGRG